MHDARVRLGMIALSSEDRLCVLRTEPGSALSEKKETKRTHSSIRMHHIHADLSIDRQQRLVDRNLSTARTQSQFSSSPTQHRGKLNALGEEPQTPRDILLLDPSLVRTLSSEPRSKFLGSSDGKRADHDSRRKAIQSIRSCDSGQTLANFAKSEGPDELWTRGRS